MNKETHLWRWWERGVRKRNICRPRSCGSSGSSRGSRAAASSSDVSPPPRWSPSPGPWSGPGSCQPPSSSKASKECKTKLPEMKNVGSFRF